jgi:hypothetical protein
MILPIPGTIADSVGVWEYPLSVFISPSLSKNSALFFTRNQGVSSE